MPPKHAQLSRRFGRTNIIERKGMESMQTATFIKTIKWLYALEIDESLDYFRTGFREYLSAGRPGIVTRIEDTYSRGILLNSRVRQLEEHPQATELLDAFGLSSLYDGDWWQTIVSTFLRILAAGESESEQAESIRETLDSLDALSERMRILVSCVGPLQQLVVPAAVQRLTDFDDVLTLEVHSVTEAPTITRMEAVLSATSELYAAMCRIHDVEQSHLQMVHMSSESGFRFDFSGEAVIVVEIKRLLVDAWQRIRNQDTPNPEALNAAMLNSLASCQKIEERRESGKLSQKAAQQMRQQLSTLAMKMFDQGVQIREIPDTDTVNNRHLMEQISQRHQPATARTVRTEQQSPVAVPSGKQDRTAAATDKSTEATSTGTATKEVVEKPSTTKKPAAKSTTSGKRKAA